ncbi:MAG TPA: acyltransferase [Blastocatellia bacterium]|nr:acyltransferase [Blastocatellia bacterium]
MLFIDVLRLFSLLLIVSYHFNAELLQLFPQARIVFDMVMFRQPVGDVGVTLFIMLSGASLMSSARAGEKYGAFLYRRGMAIFPSYWIAYLAVTAALFFVRGSLQGNGEPWKIPLTVIGIDGFLGSLTNSYYYLVGEWFLGFILLTYLFFPILSKLVSRYPTLTFGGVIVFSVAATYVCRHVTWLPTLHNPLVRLPDFFFGMSYARYRLDKKWSCGVAGGIAVILAPHLPEWLPEEIPAVMLGAGITAVTGAVCNFVRPTPGVQGAITRLAALSFLAFLVHHWVIYLSVPRFNVSNLSRGELYYLFAIDVAISFLIAKLLQRPSEAIRKMLQV